MSKRADGPSGGPEELPILALATATVLFFSGCQMGGESNPAQQQPASPTASPELAAPDPAAPAPENPAPAQKRPPNIVVIFTDDHGYADLGAQKVRDEVLTPNIDQLAGEGVLATNGYVTAPQCVPSRAGLLTGVYQGRFGLENNENGPLTPEQVTIAEHLKTRGYVSGMAGKWHLGIQDSNRHNVPAGANPQDYFALGQGFDEYFEGYLNFFTASHDTNGTPVNNPPQRVEDNRFRVDVATDWAVSFIKRHAQKPFFLYLPYFAPHVPLEAPQADQAHFADEADEKRRLGLAMIFAIDRGVGAIRQALETLNLTQETLIFFIGDNGAPVIPPDWDGSLNDPLVGEKGMLTDGGIRVPFVLAWPGTVPGGQVYDFPLSSLDVARTALVQAGVTELGATEGVDLIPILSAPDPQPAHETLYWRWVTQSAIRTQRWKLIRLGNEKTLLFDHQSTGGELMDVSDTYPDIVADLEGQLSAWSQSLSPPGLPAKPLTPHERALYRYNGLID